MLIFTAPSGAGKTTIVRHLLQAFEELSFSVSATTRPRRAHELEGRDYYFMDVDRFKELAAGGAFVEWEEVYPGRYYGTLRSEIERLWSADKSILFDIDVKGAATLKRAFPDRSLAVFVKPPSQAVLVERLRNRATETPSSLEMRLQRATEELTWENKFDKVLVNEQLGETLETAEAIVREYLYPALS
jgi:guanylate kinase